MPKAFKTERNEKIYIDREIKSERKRRRERERKRQKERERKTVVLFSLVWHYLSLLINPLRPSA